MAQAGEVLGAQDLIAYLLKEPKIRQKVALGLKSKAREYSHCKIVLEEERIYFGKYNWGGLSESYFVPYPGLMSGLYALGYSISVCISTIVFWTILYTFS